MSEHAPERESARESESAREDLKQSVERQSTPESGSERSKESKEHSIESAREKLRTSADKPSEKEKTREPKPAKRRRLVSASERTAAYKSALHDVQRQLPPLQRTFSKVVHAPFIEEASEALEETIYRPSFLIAGSIGALIIGTMFYLVARAQGWSLSGSEFTVSLFVGGVIGWLGEMIWRRTHRSRKA